jgi:hypothetical protein
MVGFRLVAVKTGIIGLAALEFNGHDIYGTSVVEAARVRVYLYASYRNSRDPDLQLVVVPSEFVPAVRWQRTAGTFARNTIRDSIVARQESYAAFYSLSIECTRSVATFPPPQACSRPPARPLSAPCASRIALVLANRSRRGAYTTRAASEY